MVAVLSRMTGIGNQMHQRGCNREKEIRELFLEESMWPKGAETLEILNGNWMIAWCKR